MPLRQLDAVRGMESERVLIFGGSGSGKTYDWKKFIEQHLLSGWRGRVYVIEPDDGTERDLWMFDPVLVKALQDSYYHCDTFKDALEALDAVRGKLKPGDWVVVEMLGRMWEMAPENWVASTYHGGMEEYQEQAKNLTQAPGTNAPDFQRLLDWTAIKRDYCTDFVEKLKLLNHTTGANVICTTEAEPVRQGNRDESRNDSPELLDLFGSIGWRPAGEKRNAHRFHTILYKWASEGGSKFHVRSPKNRGGAIPPTDVPPGVSAIDLYLQVMEGRQRDARKKMAMGSTPRTLG